MVSKRWCCNYGYFCRSAPENLVAWRFGSTEVLDQFPTPIGARGDQPRLGGPSTISRKKAITAASSRKWLKLELALVLAEATGRRLGAIRQLSWDELIYPPGRSAGEQRRTRRVRNGSSRFRRNSAKSFDHSGSRWAVRSGVWSSRGTMIQPNPLVTTHSVTGRGMLRRKQNFRSSMAACGMPIGDHGQPAERSFRS